jgi:hypothetical protein
VYRDGAISRSPNPPGARLFSYFKGSVWAMNECLIHKFILIICLKEIVEGMGCSRPPPHEG